MTLKFNEDGYPYEDLIEENKKLESRIEVLNNSLSIALEINDNYQRDNKNLNDEIKEAGEINKLHQELNKKLKDQARAAEGETSIIKGIGINSPEMKEKDALIQELRMRIRDMLMISEQHRNILGAEITTRKRLEKEVKDLKVQMSEYMSMRVDGSRMSGA